MITRAVRRNRLATAFELLLSLFVALLLLPLAMQGAHAAPNDVILCSSDAGGIEGNNVSVWPSISADGRYVAFLSVSTNLVPGVTGTQIYRKDLLTDNVALVSAKAGGTQGDGASGNPAISADGRYVAFYSTSTNLVTGVTGQQIYRKDMLTGEVRLASAKASGVKGNNASIEADISDDGRYVIFSSAATNLVTPNTTGHQVFRKDLVTGEVKLASAKASGKEGNNVSFNPKISGDSRYATFVSAATNLVTPSTTSQQVFRKDMMTGEVRLVSAKPGGAQGNGGNALPDISCDGRYVSFISISTNLIPGVTGQQIYRKDVATKAIVLVSESAGGTQGNGGSAFSSISPDGRYVAFDSTSGNLVTPNTTGQQVFRKDLMTGAVVLVSAEAGGAEGNNTSAIPSMTPDGRYVAFYSAALNLVTPNTTQAQVFRKELDAPYCFYFAEGYTGEGFQEYLCLGNPGTAPLNVKVTYLISDGTSQNASYNVPADSRFTVDVNAVVGADKEVSIKCQASSSFIAERPMYFAYGGQWTGGHDAVGATAPASNWYFAEGYTGQGFDEWICVLNPGDLPAELTFRFQTQEEGEKVVTGNMVGPNTRASFRVNDMLGGAYQTSLKLEADHCVVAERPMYFDYAGTGGYSWTGGHCVMGVPMLASSYYFAEGTTRAGFEEWLTIQNPGANDITVTATYFLADGSTVIKNYPVPAGRRSTVLVNSPAEVGEGKDVSVRLTCPTPFLAERPMYFDYQGLGSWGWRGGHCVIGSTESSTDWFFAEGYTGSGFEEWLCIQNPQGTDAAVTITYYPEGGGTPIVSNHNVGANSRFTVPVNADAGADQAISAKVNSTVPVIVERPMYFSYGPAGWQGGHDVVGYAP